MTPAAARTPFISSEGRAISTAGEWMTGLATGSFATALCVIAIAFLGLLVLHGRVPLRAGLTVVLGCFILLGAPTVANALLALGTRNAGSGTLPPSSALTLDRPPLPLSSYDPYAGASLRQD